MMRSPLKVGVEDRQDGHVFHAGAETTIGALDDLRALVVFYYCILCASETVDVPMMLDNMDENPCSPCLKGDPSWYHACVLGGTGPR